MLRCLVIFLWALLLPSVPVSAQILYGFGSYGKFIHPKTSALSGIASLGIDIKDNYNKSVVPKSTGLKIVFKIDNVPVSGVLTSPYEFTFDTSKLTDGPHALSVELLATTDPVGNPPTGYRARGKTIVTQNGNAKSTRGLPAFGVSYITKQFSAPIADWLKYDGNTRPQIPAPPSAIDVAVKIPSANGIFHLMEDWTIRRPLGVTEEVYSPSVEFAIQDGATVIQQYYPPSFVPANFPESAKNYNQFAFWDGPAQRARVSPMSTWIPVPDGPGWYGIDTNLGRLVLMTRDGNVTTLAGRFSDPLILASVGNADTTYRSKGNFIGPAFKFPHDVAVDVRNPRILYVADTYNQRIAKVDLSTGTISTFAGQPGVEGIKDGPASQATFHYPSSVETMPDGTIYVAQFGNDNLKEGPIGAESGIRRISPDGMVSTVSTELVPFVVRRTSYGKLIVGHKTTGDIVELDPVTKARRAISKLATSTWNWLSVDRWGTVGPLDTIYYVSSLGHPPGLNHNNYIYRVNPHTGVALPGFTIREGGYLLNKGNTNLGDAENVKGSYSHYLWEAVPDDEEGLFLIWGFGCESPYVWELRPDVTREYDFDLYTAGKYVYLAGTVRHVKRYDKTDKTPFDWPFGIRPSFTGLYGSAGHHFLNLPSFEEISGWPAEKRVAWYQSGMGGSTSRLELTGTDLRALDYFVCKSSHRSIDADCPKLPLPSDRTPPVISNLEVKRTGVSSATITWNTDEPTIGFVAFANGGAINKHRWSAPEEGYTSQHSRIIDFLEGVVNLQVLAKDNAGNSAWSANVTLLK